MNREGQAADIDQVMICGEGRAAADSQYLRKAFDIDLDETVVPADALREPALQGTRTFRAHHQASVVIDTLAMAEQNHCVLEILRVDGERMFAERTCQGAAPVEGHAGGDTEVCEALTPDTERQRVLEGLESRQKSVGLNHDPRTDRGGAGLLEVADELIHIDRAAIAQPAYADVRIDHHDGFDMLRQMLEQAAQGAGFAPVHTVVETSPSGLAQPQDSVVRRPVADEPHAVAVGSERLHELFEAVFEIEYGSDDGKRQSRDDTPRVSRQNGGEIDRKVAGLVAFEGAARGDRVATPHVRAQSKIERVRVHDEIGDSQDEDRESNVANVGDRQGDPSRQQRAYRKRREKRPCPPRFHAVAAAIAAAAGRRAGSREYNSARTSLSSAI